MRAEKNRVVALYAEKASQQWIVRDDEGNFWSLPNTDNAWDERRPYTPSEWTDLEPVPGHYKDMLGLPS